MSEPNNVQANDETHPSSPAAGSSGAAALTSASLSSSSGSDELDPLKLQAELQAARVSSEALKSKLLEFEKAEQSRRDAELSENDRLKKELERTRAEARSAAIALKSSNMRIQSPELVEKLLPTDVAPENLEQAIRDLAVKYPYLVAPESTAAGSPARQKYDPLLTTSDGKPLIPSFSDPNLWKRK